MLLAMFNIKSLGEGTTYDQYAITYATGFIGLISFVIVMGCILGSWIKWNISSGLLKLLLLYVYFQKLGHLFQNYLSSEYERKSIKYIIKISCLYKKRAQAIWNFFKKKKRR